MAYLEPLSKVQDQKEASILSPVDRGAVQFTSQVPEVDQGSSERISEERESNENFALLAERISVDCTFI